MRKDEVKRLQAEIEHWEAIGDYCWILVLIRSREIDGTANFALQKERFEYIRKGVEEHFEAIKKLRG